LRPLSAAGIGCDMPCYRPLQGYRARTVNASGKRGIVFNKKDGFVDLPVKVPCGQCIGCRLERSRQWAIRCIHEASLHDENSFITLTYSPENLPDGGTLVLEDFQNFMKRFREAIEPKRIRFFHCGEYGENLGRPHYHAIIFGISPCVCELWPEYERGKRQVVKCGCPGREEIMNAWKLGGVSRVTSVCYDSARYVADYIGKADIDAQGYRGKHRPFQLMSKGLGRGYVDTFETQLRDNLGVTVRGVPVGMPRYYARRLEIDWAKERLLNPVDDKVPSSKVAQVWSGPADARVFDLALPRLQRELDAIAKQKLKRKGTQ